MYLGHIEEALQADTWQTFRLQATKKAPVEQEIHVKLILQEKSKEREIKRVNLTL